MYIVLSESVSTIHYLSHGKNVPRPLFLVHALSFIHSIVFSKLLRASSGYIAMSFKQRRTFFFQSSSEYFRNHWFYNILTWHFVVHLHTTPATSHMTSAA